MSSADRDQQQGSFEVAGSRCFVSPLSSRGPLGGENLGKSCAGRPEQEKPGVPHHVPGSTVMPIDPFEILRGLPDLVFRSPTSLGSFAKSSLRSASSDSQSDGNPRGMPRSVWPMPPPYPQVLREDHRSLPEGEFKKLAVDLVVISLNYLDLGRPTRAPITCLAGGQLTRAQWEHAERISKFVEGWFEQGTLTASDMGRTASKVEDLEKVLSDLRAGVLLQPLPSRANFLDDGIDGDLGLLRGQKFGSFKEVEADRLKFRGFPDFDPRPYLDPLSRGIYEEPFRHSTPPSEYTGVVPHVRVHCSRAERVKLYSLLDSSRRIRLYSPDKIRRRHCSGVFGVVKSLEYDRLILDSRPHNLLEAPPGRFIQTLGAGHLVGQIHLQEGEMLYSSTNDIRDFYHLFQVNDQRSRRNALVGTITPSEARNFQCFEPWMWGQEELFVGLSCLAMGDTQAVELAQTCHVGLCLQHQIVNAEDLISISLPIPRGPVFSGVVIDDFLALAVSKKAPNRDIGERTAGAAIADKAMETYKQVHLIPHEEKATRDEVKGEFWGIQLDGIKGHVRGSLKRAIPLVKIILEVLRIGVISVGLVEVIAGSLIGLYIYRRRLMCLLDQVFESIKGRDQRTVFVISSELREELLLNVVGVLIAVVELRADYSKEIFAVDASNWGEAVTSCTTSALFTKELSRHALSKGVWTRLLSPAKARARGHGLLHPEEELPGGSDAAYRSHPLWVQILKSGRFKLSWQKRSERRRHINISELRSFLRAEREAKLPNIATRCIIGGDSQVALGALLKGRSSSKQLNKELERSLGFHVGGGVQPSYLYFPPSLNPADHPTRGRSIPSPEETVPDWWEPLLLGDVRKFDRWLESIRHDPMSLSGLPSFEELTKIVQSEIQVQVQKRYLRQSKHLRELINESHKPKQPLPSSGPASFLEELYQTGRLQGRLVFPRGADPQSCLNGPGYIEVFSGAGGFCREVARLSGRWVLSYEGADSKNQERLGSEAQTEILELLKSGLVLGIGASPRCSTFSRAVSPSWRSSFLPFGLPGLTEEQKQRVAVDNRCAEFLAGVFNVAEKEFIPSWVENPVSSFLWWLPAFVDLNKRDGVGFWCLDFCAFGTRWRRRTRVLTSTCLRGHKTLCPGCKGHQVLRGRSQLHRCSWASCAQAQPRGLSLCLAMALTGAAGDRPEFRTFDPSSCARCGHARIGEASHPGPAKRGFVERAAMREGVELREVPLVSRRTENLEERLWEGFVEWLLEDCDKAQAEELLISASTVAPLLELYGENLFKIGASLSSFRHLIAFAQRKHHDFRLYGRGCWTIVSRWESVEPLVHRPPLPEAVCAATAAVAFSWGWVRFGVLLLVAFKGILRIGEILKAVRQDLVLPSDLLTESTERFYVRVSQPKTGKRGGGKQQHVTIHDSVLASVCENVFRHARMDEKLYPFSGQTFRRRWNEIMAVLGIPKELSLTPASVRDGGAVAAYRSGTAVQDILWRMRIQHLHTLQHYLQELAAENVISALKSKARSSVKAGALLLPHYLETLRCRGPVYGP